MAPDLFWKVITLYLCKLSLVLGGEKHTVCLLDSCTGITSQNGYMLQFCTRHNATMHDRCCIRQTPNKTDKEIIGMDLSNCSLSSLDVLDSAPSPNGTSFDKKHVLYMDLHNNAVTACEDMNGFANLKNLTIPTSCQCPGGIHAWGHYEQTSVAMWCLDEVNVCVEDKVTCPSNSSCVMGGPGDVQCQCDKGFYGYKCQRQGTFPVVEYFSTIVAITVLLSVSSWVLLRREAKNIY